MNIKAVFKKYPKSEPNYNGINYLTIVASGDNFDYSITYFNNDGEFEPQYGKVVAFVDADPTFILNSL
tara:strand:- start:242 stop:445 length:204 start_codon:yes stop_codon:yes gene_type:complete